MHSKLGSSEITALLQKIGQGDQDAERELAPLVYDELRRLAKHHMRKERADHTLQTTGLVHEAYLRLMGNDNIEWHNRTQFFAVAATVMRRILVDYARTRRAAKRGGELSLVTLEGAQEPGSRDSWSKILDVHRALSRLAAIDARQARVVELRFFAGLDIEEVAQILNVSGRTIKRDWGFAQAWLYAEIASSYGKDFGSVSPPGKKTRV